MSPLSFAKHSSSSLRFRRAVQSSLVASLACALTLSAPLSALAQAKDAAKPDAAKGEIPAEIAITERARAHFRAGVNFLQDPDGARYAEAYREFQAAYAESPSWKILGNLGISAMKLERDGEAVEAFTKYLAESTGRITDSERAQVQRDLDTLSAGVVWVTVRSTPAGAQLTDERIPLAGSPVLNRYGEMAQEVRVGVRPGRHRMTVELAGYEPSVWSFDAQSGSTLDHTFELKKVEEKSETPAAIAPTSGSQQNAGPTERPIPTGVYIGAAATGVLLVGGVVTGILASGKNGDFEEKNDRVRDNTCGATCAADAKEAESLRDSGQTYNLVADVMFGGAIVAAGVTTYLFLTRPEVTPGQDTAFIVAPTALPNGGGLWMQGKF